MKRVEYEDGKRLEQTHTCTCGGKLSLCWGGAFGINSFVLRCVERDDHNTIMRPAELEPYDIPGFNLYNLRGRHDEMVQELGEEKARALQPYEQVASLTKQQAGLILQTIWPDAPAVEVMKAAIICRQYGLNPLMKHIFLLPFKKYDKRTGEIVRIDWAIHIGIKANRLIARRVDRFSYLGDTPRIMTKQEQETIFGEVDNNNIWAITKLRDSAGNEAPGYGSWPKGQPAYGADRGNSAANMAFIHSERNALDRLFPGEMPQDVGVIDEQYIDGEYQVTTDQKPPLVSSPASTQKEPAATKHARGKGKKEDDNKAGESAQRPPGKQRAGAGPGGGVDRVGATGAGAGAGAAGEVGPGPGGAPAGGRQGGAGPTTTATTPSGADEHALLSAASPPENADAGESALAGNGFSIRRAELADLLTKSHWSEGTARSWITSKWHDVEDGENLEAVLKRLNRSQAEVFMRELQQRAENQPNLL